MVLTLNIPTIRYQLARRQLNFIRKVVRNSEDQIPTQLFTSWCDNKRKPGAPLQNNKKNLAQNIRLIVPGPKNMEYSPPGYTYHWKMAIGHT